MNEVIKTISNIIIIMMVLTIFGALIGDYIKEHYGYEYIDFNDNRGISNKCIMNDDGIFCKIDGKLIGVKQYGKR